MNERQNNAMEMVSTNDLQIKTPAFQHGSLSWLTLADTLRTASIDFDEYKVKNIKELLGVPLTQ